MHLIKGFQPCLIHTITFTTTIPTVHAAGAMTTALAATVAPVTAARAAMGQMRSTTVPTSANVCSKRVVSSSSPCT